MESILNKIIEIEDYNGNTIMALEIDEKGNPVYSMDAEEFAKNMKNLVEAGANIVGGCCGTTPEFIEKLAEELK